MKRIFAVKPADLQTDLALFLMRVIAGSAFMIHGWSKIQAPMSWMGPEATIPGFFLALAAISEFGGGLAWIIGLVTRLAAFGICCTMTVACCFHFFMRGDPFVSATGGPAA